MSKKLPEEIFLHTFTLVPRIAMNLLIEDQHGALLLTKRAIPPGKNLWHYPGSFLLKDETIDACLKRIAKDELGIDLPQKIQLVGVFENVTGDPRGHVVDVLYKATLELVSHLKPIGGTKEIQFFTRLPKSIGFGQDSILRTIGYQ